MKQSTRTRIKDIFSDIEGDDPDISTERLLGMTADIAHVEYATVVDTVFRSGCSSNSCPNKRNGST